MKSICQFEKECFICKTTQNLNKHHLFGGCNRDKAEKYGMWVYLCVNHHTVTNASVHLNSKVDKELKRYGQKIFEYKYSRNLFIREFHHNYLEENEDETNDTCTKY